MKLYTYWRSLATFRVRIALNLKGLKYEAVYVDLDGGQQNQSDYKAVNPQMVIPSLVEDDGNVLYQSLAIMEYLDEVYPEPPLLPADPKGRARVRALSLITVADSHPLIVPRVRNHLAATFNLDEEGKVDWVRHWFAAGLDAYEGHLSRDKATGALLPRRHGDHGRPLPRQPRRRHARVQGHHRQPPDGQAHRRALPGRRTLRQRPAAAAAGRAGGALTSVMAVLVTAIQPPTDRARLDARNDVRA